MEFTISLAGRKIGIRCFFEQTFTRCRDYLTEGEAELEFIITREDLEHEREKALRESAADRKKTEAVSDMELEALALYRKIAETLPAYNTWLMHGSAVCAGDGAVLFAAASGVGKSTHTALWLEQIPGAFVVNGDKPLLRLQDGICFVCGTPWSGKEGWNRNVFVPLKAICMLSRGTENHIRSISFQEAFPVLLQQTYRPEKTAALEKTFELLQQLEKTVRFYHLECNREPEAAHVAFKAILSGESNDGNMAMTFEDELARSGRLVYRNAGTSMLPLIREGKDLIVLERCDGKDLPECEVVLFRRPNVKGRGEYVLHRILKRDPDGNYQIAGDNCTTCEIVHPEQILARLTEVKRPKRTIRTSDPAYRAYVRLWCVPYPLRFRLLKAAGLIRKTGSKLLRKRNEREKRPL